MSRTDNKISLAGGQSRSRLVIGLLVLTLILVLALAWQANRTILTNNETVTGVLQDYARLVAEEYTRRAMGEVGYYGYYSYITVLRQSALEQPEFPFEVKPPESGSPEARAEQLVDYLFFIDGPEAEVTIQGTARPTVEEYMLRRSKEWLTQKFPDSGFKIEHITVENRIQTIVFAKSETTGRFYGFAVNRKELSSWLDAAFDKDVLLPKALAGGAVTNEFVYLRFNDNAGQILFETSTTYDPYLIVEKNLGDEYEGIFKSHTIITAINPDAAETLVIGGLPRSRLPALLAVIILTVGLLIASIRQLQREQAVMKMRTDFVSEVSHELRTPLTQIRMFAETLLFERFKAEDDRHRALEIINRESQRLIHLVENVLQFSDRPGDQRKLMLADTLIAPLIEGVVEEFLPLAESTDARLETRLDLNCRAAVDSDAIRQILLNLLDNAVKYGPEGQMIVISLSEASGRVQISVTDQGPGIPRKERERIWGGYYRLNRERSSAIAGTGIGLAVVRELAVQHDGKSWVESGADTDTEAGACFIIELPSSDDGDLV